MTTGLLKISDQLSQRLAQLPPFRSVHMVYDPLSYARGPHQDYLTKWGQGPKEILLLGMNPGPFGMAQTGVPFGDPVFVREFLGISGRVFPPQTLHPARPIIGLTSDKREVSGQRLWGWVHNRFVKPEVFFARFFVVNYCPLAFMDVSGKNITPDKLPKEERDPLYQVCDAALQEVITSLKPKWVIGVGAFAKTRAGIVAQKMVENVPQIGTILHPSPASPKANKDWAGEIEKQFAAMGIAL